MPGTRGGAPVCLSHNHDYVKHMVVDNTQTIPQMLQNPA
jgi:hypothetical protein